MPTTASLHRPDKRQRTAIAHRDGHLLVTGGPGTGKTFALLQRLVEALRGGEAPPQRIALLTHDGADTACWRRRLGTAMGADADRLFVGSFESFALHWLRSVRPLRAVAETERERVLRHLHPELSAARRADVEAEIAAYVDTLGAAAPPPPPAAVAAYLAALDRAGAVDRAALVALLPQQLATDPALRTRLAAGVTWVFVDDAQDLGAAERRLLTLLAEHARVTIAGDPQLAVASADHRSLARLAQALGATGITLERDYRHREPVRTAALALLRAADEPIPRLRRGRAGGPPREVFAAADADHEATWIAARIAALVAAGQAAGEVAVLYRLDAQSGPLLQALERQGLAAAALAGSPFYRRPPLLPVGHFLGAAADPGSPDHLALLAAWPGADPAVQEKLEAALPPVFDDFFAAAAGAAAQLPIKNRLKELDRTLARCRRRAADQGLAAAVDEALSFLGPAPQHPEAQRLLALAAGFTGDLTAFAAALGGRTVGGPCDRHVDTVTLMPLHAARGLEFPVVIIAGLEEGLLPCRLPGLAAPPAQERRLFYLGITRARERLILTSAARRRLMGRLCRHAPSRFLGEMSRGMAQMTGQLGLF